MFVFKIYRAFSSCFLPHCRYFPSCSEYAQEAILGRGFWKGLQLTLRRLLRCHPWGGYGYDPVPNSHQPSPSPLPSLGEGK